MAARARGCACVCRCSSAAVALGRAWGLAAAAWAGERRVLPGGPACSYFCLSVRPSIFSSVCSGGRARWLRSGARAGAGAALCPGQRGQQQPCPLVPAGLCWGCSAGSPSPLRAPELGPCVRLSVCVRLCVCVRAGVCTPGKGTYFGWR